MNTQTQLASTSEATELILSSKAIAMIKAEGLDPDHLKRTGALMKPLKGRKKLDREIPPFWCLKQAYSTASGIEKEAIVAQLWVRAEIASSALNEAIWDLCEEWDRQVDVDEFDEDGVVLETFQANFAILGRFKRLQEIDASLNRLQVLTPLPKTERRDVLRSLQDYLNDMHEVVITDEIPFSRTF